MLSNFCLKVEFLVAIASNKQKQIDQQLMTDWQLDVTRAQLFGLYVVKYHPNVYTYLLHTCE